MNSIQNIKKRLKYFLNNLQINKPFAIFYDRLNIKKKILKNSQMLIKKNLKLIIKLIENLLEHINQKLIADLIPFSYL